jgi:hypothetical protein
MDSVSYTISARGKNKSMPILEFLQSYFSSISLDQVDSVFGFLEASTLYSGRPFLKRQISDADVATMKKKHIGLRIPLTNHFLTEREYLDQASFLEKYQVKGNSVICTNDQLATWIRRDFPLYQIEASVLKEIDSHEGIKRALELYDTVILPMYINYNTAFLSAIRDKDRITLFGNAGCALTCPRRICYETISETNKKLASQNLIQRNITFLFRMGFPINWCSNRLHPRKLKGIVDFDLNQLYELGFRRFKMLRENRVLETGH